MMRIAICLLTYLALCTATFGQSISKSDSIEVVSRIDDWNMGWGAKDYRLATKWYSDSAEFTNAFGHHRIGRLEIEKLIKYVFQLPFVMAGESKVTNQTLVPLEDNIILVVTKIERIGQKTSDEKELGVRHTTHHRIFRKDQEWLIVGHLISDARDTGSGRH